MNVAIRKARWLIIESYIPSKNAGEGSEFASHEGSCLLHAGDCMIVFSCALDFRSPIAAN